MTTDSETRAPLDVRDLRALRLNQLALAAKAGMQWSAPAPRSRPAPPAPLPPAPPEPVEETPPQVQPPDPEQHTAGDMCEPQWEEDPAEKEPEEAAGPEVKGAEAAAAPEDATVYPDFEQTAPVLGMDALRSEMETLLRGTLRTSVERGAARATPATGESAAGPTTPSS